MKPRNLNFGNLTVVWIAAVFLLVTAHSVSAQNTRYLDRRVATGERIEFQWLNYDEKSCKDRGYPRLTINTAPSLGSYRTVRRKFTQQNGRCKGKKLSVLLVYYVAGRTKGRDRTSYTIHGSSDVRINLKIRVQ